MFETRRVFKLFLRLAPVVLLAGCATGTGLYDIMPRETQLVTASKYSEIEQQLGIDLDKQQEVRSSKLWTLCVAYGKLKRYNKLFTCIDRLEANFRKGDTAMNDVEDMRKRSPFWSGMAEFGASFMGGRKVLEGDLRPYAPLMRAEAYMDLGDYPRAIENAKIAHDLAPTQMQAERSFRIMTLTSLALANAFNGDKPAALKWAGELEQLSTAYPYTLLKVDKYAGLAKIYIALGDFPKALEAANNAGETAFGSFAKGLADALIGAPTGENIWTWQELPRIFIRTKAQFETGHFAEAKAGYDQLLGIPQTRDNGDIYWLILHDRGRIAEKEGNRAQAIELYRKAVEVIEGQRASINTEASKIGFIGDKQAVYQSLVAALIADGHNVEAFEYVERAKSRALVDMLAAKRDFAIRTANAQEVRTLLAKADATESEARVQSADPALAGKRSLAVKLKQDLRTQAPELAALVTVTYSSAKDIQARLPADEALIEYYYDDKKVYAFIVTREQLQVVWLDSANLVNDVRTFRETLESPHDNRYLDLAQRLYRQLFQPVEGPLGGKRQILIVAHGALHYLPFNALHDGREYLIDRYRLRLLPSASVMPYLRPVRPTTRALLAFGNPDLGDPRLDLKYAQAEAQAVTKVLPGSRVLTRREASETAFKRQGTGYAYLHFASHGDFNADSPLNSSLLLAKDRENDGTLTVGELYSMRLNADLVTLSACETGLGKIANGDDVVGLTRGFLYAGSRSIVASLWKVDDEATAYLMTRFYSALKGASKREALRLAQIETRKKYPHPYFWAAFQLTGEAS